jgi:hypothetical protein
LTLVQNAIAEDRGKYRRDLQLHKLPAELVPLQNRVVGPAVGTI